MTLKELFENYLGFLWDTFSYDAEVLSQGWIYYWALIPALIYILFFFIKWTVLLLPFYSVPLIFIRLTSKLFEPPSLGIPRSKNPPQPPRKHDINNTVSRDIKKSNPPNILH